MEEIPELAQSFIDLRMGQCYRNYMRSFTQNDFNMVQILDFVRKHGQAHPNEMSEKFSIATSQMAVLLNHLETAGLIERVKDESDHRKTIIKITSKGSNLDKILLEKYRQFITDVFESMGEDDAKHFVDLFAKFIAASFKIFEERNVESAQTINAGSAR